MGSVRQEISLANLQSTIGMITAIRLTVVSTWAVLATLIVPEFRRERRREV